MLGFGTYDTRRHPRIATLLEGLRAHGEEVVEANCPLGFSTSDRVEMVHRPWLAARLAVRLPVVWWQVARGARRARRDGSFDAVLVGYLGQLDVLLARVLFPRTTIVLDLLVFGADTARDRGVRSRLTLAALIGLDRLAARCADLILVDTEESVALLAEGQRRKAVVVPVGAGAPWFTAGGRQRPGRDEAPLRVVFFGLFTPLQGATVIGQALEQLAGCPLVEVTMIGTGQDWQATREAAAANASVTWLDWVEAEALPDIVARHDVCLGIFGTSPKASRVVPTKVYQGAAAGCAIVTSDTAPQRRALPGAALFVPAGDADALASALRRLAGDRDSVARLGGAARRRSEEQFTGSAVAQPLLARLEGNPA